MVMTIEDGTGKGYAAKVNELNQLSVRSITETAALESARSGLGTNIVTGILSLTTGNESAVLYVKNTSSKYDYIIDAIAIGLGKANGTVNDVVYVRGYSNPTGGTLISDATSVEINNNRNFGKSSVFTGLAYQGGEGKTVTGGDQSVILFNGAGGRLLAGLNLVVPENKSFAITVQPNCDSGLNLYCAFVSYYEEKNL